MANKNNCFKWKIGDIVALEEDRFVDYLLIVEVFKEDKSYGVISLKSERLINNKWETDKNLFGYEKTHMVNLGGYKYIP